MASHLRLAVVASALAFGAGLQFPDAAMACSSIAQCTSPVRLFPVPQGIPGNLVYFKLVADNPGTLTLRRKGGAALAASIRTVGSDRVYAPNADLPADAEFELEYTTVCPGGSTLVPTQVKYAFTTIAAMPAEGLEPSLSHVAQGLLNPDDPTSMMAFQRVFFNPGWQTGSVEHLTDNFANLDGRWAGMSNQTIEFNALCDTRLTQGNSCGYVAPTLGWHELEAWSTVVGASVQPPHVKRRFELSCGCAGGAADAGSAADAGTAAIGTGPARASADASTSGSGVSVPVHESTSAPVVAGGQDQDVETPVPSVRASSHGCAVTQVGANSPVAAAIALLLSCVALASRRRSPARYWISSR